MKPPPFHYHAPDTLDEALALLGEYGDEAKPLAGGQSLVPAMNFRLAQPAVLVDLNRVEELFGIRDGDGEGLRIGAMTRQRTVERSPRVAAHAPLVAAAMPHIAHPQIRNRGTFGGSLAHADPAAELPAVAVALGATVIAQSTQGRREIPARAFFLGLFETALAPDELLVEVVVPALPPRTGTAFDEVARRHGDYALAGAAAVITLADDGTVSDGCLTFFSVSDGPLVADAALAALRGQHPRPGAIAAAADAAMGEVDPVGDIHATAAFRRHLAGVLARRTLTRAVEVLSSGDEGGE